MHNPGGFYQNAISRSVQLANHPKARNIVMNYVGSGTPDPSFDPRVNIQYIGGFKIPFTSEDNTDQNSTRGAKAFCLNAARDGFFIGNSNRVSEWTMPTLVDDEDHTNMNAATLSQNFYDLFESIPNKPTTWNTPEQLGWLKVINNRLYFSYYGYYLGDAQNPDHNIGFVADSTNLAGSSTYGMMSLGQADYHDSAARYCFEIPADKQSMFNNYTHAAGVTAELAIIGRSSMGHTFQGIDFDSILTTDTDVASTRFCHHTISNPVDGSSGYNRNVTSYYASQFGIENNETAWRLFLDSAPGSRVSTFEGYGYPAQSVYDSVSYLLSLTCGVGFIPPGSNSVVYIGNMTGYEYGLNYKSHTLEYGTDGLEFGGPGPISATDYRSVAWQMNLNDISGSVNPHDPQYIRAVEIDNPWLEAYDNGRFRGGITSGDFDPDTGILYLLHNNMYDPSAHPYNNMHIVTAYQITTGAA
jgi:hypothetical protein